MSRFPEFMNAKLVAEYLDLNEKKVYALANEGLLPATKVTGKWLFPKAMLDKWLLESCHHGILTDRLLIAGSDDSLLQRVTAKMANQLGSSAVVGYTPTGARQGLAMLSKGLVDVCAIHWGNAAEANLRHPALMQQYQGHKNWVLVHAFERKQGLIVSKKLESDIQAEVTQLTELMSEHWRWAIRQQGAGSMRGLDEWLQGHASSISKLNHAVQCNNERELASSIIRGQADIGYGAQSTASEFGLGFIPLCSEALELVIPKNIYFRTLQQQLLQSISNEQTLTQGEQLGGYNFSRTGVQVWSAN